MLVRGNLPWIGLAVNHVARDGAMGGHTRGEKPDGAGDLREQHDGLWRLEARLSRNLDTLGQTRRGV